LGSPAICGNPDISGDYPWFCWQPFHPWSACDRRLPQPRWGTSVRLRVPPHYSCKHFTRGAGLRAAAQAEGGGGWGWGATGWGSAIGRELSSRVMSLSSGSGLLMPYSLHRIPGLSSWRTEVQAKTRSAPTFRWGLTPKRWADNATGHS